MSESAPVTDELIPAATVILCRDSSSGIEVLMLRRNSSIGFGGAWVFPGGRVDDSDPGDDELGRARSAAVREAHEETGLDISNRPLAVWSLWIPPRMAAMVAPGKKRRFSTWFFIAEAPADPVQVDMGEIHEHRWLTPADAIALQRQGEIELVPPTFVTLIQLSAHKTISEAIDSRSQTAPQRFETRPLPGKPITLMWHGDVAYDDPGLLTEAGPRNRLTMANGAWDYQCSLPAPSSDERDGG